MSIDAMPDDWFLDSGTLGTDLIEETSIWMTGGRAVRLVGTNGARIVSKQFPCGYTGDPQTIRRKIGVTTVRYIPGAGGNGTYGVEYYDGNGNLVLYDAYNITAGVYTASIWETDGQVSDIPATTEYGRLVFEWASGPVDCILDTFLAYMMPPFGHLDNKVTPAVTTVPGAWTAIPMTNVYPVAGREYGSHGIADDSTAGVATGQWKVRETGSYTFSCRVNFDDYVGGTDCFAFRLTRGGVALWTSSRFMPTINKAAPADWDFSWCHEDQIIAGANLALQVYQYTGLAVDINAVELNLTKES